MKRKINEKQLVNDILERDKFTGASMPLYQHIPQLEKWFSLKGVIGGRFCAVRFRDACLDKYNWKDKTLLDFGCDNGMMMWEAYQHGAKLTVGIEHPAVTDCAKRVAEYIGNKSAEFYGLDLQTATIESIREKVKHNQFDVVFYMAMDSFFGCFPKWLPGVTGELLVYEKMPNSISVEEVIEWLGEYFCLVGIVGNTTDFRETRPIIWAYFKK